MLFIMFFIGVDSQFLTNFSIYTIDFHPGHEEYLLFQSRNTTIYLAEAKGWYNLFIADGENYEIYISKIQSELRFSYDKTFKVNEVPMKLAVSQGTVNLDDEFTEFFLAPIKAISATNYAPKIDQLQVCYNFSTERFSLKIALGLVCFLVLISNHGLIKSTIEPILQSGVSRRISWRGSFLPRGKVKIPQSEKETSV